MWRFRSALKRHSVILIVLGLASGVGIFTILYFLWQGQAEYSERRTFQYSFNIQNTGNELLKDAEFFVYSPVQRTANQSLLNLDTTHPYELLTDALGNRILRFRLDYIAPYETRIVRIRAELGISESSNKVPDIDPRQFLAPEKYIEINEPALIAVANRLKRDSSLETARSIYEWVSGYLEYKEYVEEDKGALYALDSKQGDCTEYMYLFNALARINGIPVRSMGGYVYPENATFKSRDYHNWSEAFIDGKWRIVDPQKKSFLENQSHYIAMRIITEESHPLLGNSHRFAYSDKALAVKMN
jgi:transglutaminase-like putative cysteine protease